MCGAASSRSMLWRCDALQLAKHSFKQVTAVKFSGMPACAGVVKAQRIDAYTVDRSARTSAAPSQRPRLIFVSVLHRKCSWEEGRRVERNSIRNWCVPWRTCVDAPAVPPSLSHLS